MVLFFLLKPVFGAALLRLRCFQKGMFAARFFSRLLHHPLQ